MITYQDYERAVDTATFINQAIQQHKRSDDYVTARTADLYDHQRNETINTYIQTLFNSRGEVVEDFTASNNQIASNFFTRLNTQRVMYSLGNGVSFIQPDEAGNADEVKAKMGEGFDRTITEAAYCACIHGVSFPFWNHDRLHLFKLTEFVPLFDEFNGTLRAGIRFWQLDKNKPMNVTFYREEGYSQWRQDDNRTLRPIDRNGQFASDEDMQAYLVTYQTVPADGVAVVVGEDNYGSLPIVPMWANRTKQSTLVGMRAAIDAYDLIKSGFANDMQDCATVYWIIRNAPGMNDSDLAKFRDRIKFNKIATVDGIDGADVQPYTQEVPYQARREFLEEIRNGIYEDFGALDVHTVSAGATNDHIDAAYQPMDENAADFEYWVGQCIEQLVRLAGIEDKPIFTRQRISNQLEQVQMVVQEAQWLDSKTILQLLPNIKPDQVAAILGRYDAEDIERFIEPVESAEEEGVFNG